MAPEGEHVLAAPGGVRFDIAERAAVSLLALVAAGCVLTPRAFSAPRAAVIGVALVTAALMPRRWLPLPAPLWRSMLVASLVALEVFQGWASQRVGHCLVELALGLQVIALATRERRSHHVLVLALIHVIAGGLLRDLAWARVWTSAALAVAPAALALTFLRKQVEQNYRSCARMRDGTVLDVARVLASRSIATPRIVLLLVACGACVAAMAPAAGMLLSTTGAKRCPTPLNENDILSMLETRLAAVAILCAFTGAAFLATGRIARWLDTRRRVAHTEPPSTPYRTPAGDDRVGVAEHARRRRFAFTREGKYVLGMILGTGFAAINTQHQMLFLVVGGLLGLVLVSGFLSELSLAGLVVHRKLPARWAVGHRASVDLTLVNEKRVWPSYACEVMETGATPFSAKRCFFLRVSAGAVQTASYRMSMYEPGTVSLGDLCISTEFPFGWFEKSDHVAAPADVIVELADHI